MDDSPPRILADADVPLVTEAFARYGPVRVIPGRAIDRAACRHADALIVRSVTRVDASTLDDTPVRFVGSATAGVDHVDLDYLGKRGIPFAAAPGSNAESVVEWTIAALLALAARHGEIAGRAIGVVGCGHVGAGLVARADALGMHVLPCDPPLADAAAIRGAAHSYVPYARLLSEADILSFHTPLTFSGAHPTYHLLDTPALAVLRPGTWVLNSSRGAVVDGAALEAAIRSGHVAAAALDVWEGEPTPAASLIQCVDIATPHIAGYGYDAKVAGARMMEQALRVWLAAEGKELPPPFDWSAAAPAAALSLVAPYATSRAAWLDALAVGAYDIREDDARFREVMLDSTLDDAERADAFTRLRRSYPVRRSWSYFEVKGTVPPELRVAVGQGMRIGPADG